MKKFDPISLIEDSISSIKDYIDQELLTENNSIDISLLKELKTENTELLNLCKELNNDEVFIQKVNDKIDRNKINALYKTERIFLSEILSIYGRNKSEDQDKSKFILAYYYDALRNDHFADENHLSKLNQLIKTQEFSGIIDKIQQENKLVLLVPDDRNLILSILTELKHPKLQAMQTNFENYKKFSGISEPEKIEVYVESPENKEKTEKEAEQNNINVSFPPKDDTLEKALQELHNLVGLEKVKKDINELINLLEIQKKRNSEGMKNVEIALHTVFLGPPGTGKTSVARLLSRIFMHLGYLSEGQLYETDREGLIAGYVGQTAIKTDKAVEESKGGVLFIDEAYALTQNQWGNDFGAEAVNTIIKRMEDYRDDLAVVVAGYTEPMKMFIDSNPGLRSRFNRYFYFEHFTSEQLLQIFEKFCSQFDFSISDESKNKLKEIFSSMDNLKTESFGNARAVRNIFEKSIQNQANRLIYWTAPKGEYLKTLHVEDIPNLEEVLESLGDQEKEEE
ncbi:AAA family ATPase [Chryseobacterium shigense]|uniref:AAA+ superfamily predicted ATPase n=1 Tax=Chryseobacterium shigense TaxID=297244 RepID=A0A841N792_9FLAO|nr:AAA family ATPase [Chryseobacterium shigense]MBB6369330.1 AAA+ superfamily predicted ATPase [Chryseobacterium shigense]